MIALLGIAAHTTGPTEHCSAHRCLPVSGTAASIVWKVIGAMEAIELHTSGPVYTGATLDLGTSRRMFSVQE